MKTSIILLFLIILIGFPSCFDNALNISSIYDPIKSYKFMGDEGKLIDNLFKYSAYTQQTTFQITDSIYDTNAKTVNYYIVIRIKDSSHSLAYYLNFKPDIQNKNLLNLNLTGAFDEKNNTGGFKIDDKGVNSLVKFFENDFLSDFQKKQEVKIIAK